MNRMQRNFSVIEPDRIYGRELIGKGGYGSVYKAHHRDWGEVAVKVMIDTEIPSRDTNKLRGEAKKLWEMNHTNIVTMFGVIFARNEYSLVLEYTRFGCVVSFVQEYTVPDVIKVSIIRDIVIGMNYLHTKDPAVFHCDLKGQNVLISEGFRAKLCDFGLSQWRSYSRMYSLAKRPPNNFGTITHIPPEKWDNINLEPTAAQDVYAFAITAWEIMSGKLPYQEAESAQINHCVKEGQRPDLNALPVSVPGWIRDMIQISWAQNPTYRPPFSRLKTLVEEHYAQEYKHCEARAHQDMYAEIARKQEEREPEHHTVPPSDSHDRVYAAPERTGMTGNLAGLEIQGGTSRMGELVSIDGDLESVHGQRPLIHPARFGDQPPGGTSQPPGGGFQLPGGMSQPQRGTPQIPGGTPQPQHFRSAQASVQDPVEDLKFPVQRVHTDSLWHDSGPGPLRPGVLTNQITHQGILRAPVQNTSGQIFDSGHGPSQQGVNHNPGYVQTREIPVQQPESGNLSLMNQAQRVQEHVPEMHQREHNILSEQQAQEFKLHEKEKCDSSDVDLTAVSRNQPTGAAKKNQNLQFQTQNSQVPLHQNLNLQAQQPNPQTQPQHCRLPGHVDSDSGVMETDADPITGGATGGAGQGATGSGDAASIQSGMNIVTEHGQYIYHPHGWYFTPNGPGIPTLIHDPQHTMDVSSMAPPTLPSFPGMPYGMPHMPGLPHMQFSSDDTKPSKLVHNHSGGGTTTVFNLSNMSGVQIGDKNVMHISSAGPRMGRGKTTVVTSKITKSRRKITSKDCDIVSNHLGNHWKRLARKLAFSEGEIDAIDCDYQMDGLREKIYQMLRRWLMRDGENAAAGRLADCLCSIGKADVAALLPLEP